MNTKKKTFVHHNLNRIIVDRWVRALHWTPALNIKLLMKYDALFYIDFISDLSCVLITNKTQIFISYTRYVNICSLLKNKNMACLLYYLNKINETD